MPDDPFFEEMDPLHKLWWYESWSAKKEEEIKRDKYLGILIGSFSNPDAAQKMIKSENPDYEVPDEHAESIARRLHKDNLEEIEKQQTAQKKLRRRKRRKLIKD